MRRAALVVALFATPAIAQVPAAAPDSARRIFNEVFIGQPAPPAFVTLADGLVYRLEIEPATAHITIREARRSSLPPLFLTPMSDASGAAQGAAYLLVPRASAEYRLDVTTDGDEPVRVRIELDPKENARWARMREETRNQPPAGLSLRVVYVGAFRSSPRNYYQDSLATASGVGVESCFALLPHSAWMKESFGGCVLFVTLLHRGNTAGNVFLLGTAPRVEIARFEDGGSASLALQFAFGQSNSAFRVSINYFVAGASGIVSRPVPLTRRRLLAELELGIAAFDGAIGHRDHRVNWVPRLGAGLQLAF